MSDTLYGVSWYGETASIAQTGYAFTEAEARRIAREGAEASDFWTWVEAQPFQIDELTDGEATPVVRADVDTEDTEDTAWVAS